nr:hypothetical protein [Olegusella massiliensis]
MIRVKTLTIQLIDAQGELPTITYLLRRRAPGSLPIFYTILWT